jgi:hypothetical protein
MFKNTKPSDVAVLLLTLTLCAILIISAVSISEGDGDGKIAEIVAFILGSITTIIGEYILINKKKDEKDDK